MHGVHGQVIAELQFRVFEEACQLLPERQRVVARLARLAAGQHGFASGQDVFPDFVEQWRSFLLAQKMTGGVIHLLVAC